MRAIELRVQTLCFGLPLKTHRDLRGPPDAPPDRRATGARRSRARGKGGSPGWGIVRGPAAGRERQRRVPSPPGRFL